MESSRANRRMAVIYRRVTLARGHSGPLRWCYRQPVPFAGQTDSPASRALWMARNVWKPVFTEAPKSHPLGNFPVRSEIVFA